MNFRKLDERWAKFGASSKDLADEVSFAAESLAVPGEGPLAVRFCTRKGVPQEKFVKAVESPKTAIVLHHTALYAPFGALMGGSPEDNRPDKRGAHFLIGRDGNAYRLANTEYIANHTSSWNDNSIGIEIDNIGELIEKDGKLHSEYDPSDVYCQKSDAGVFLEKEWRGGKLWATWTESQYVCLGKLLKALCAKHGIPPTLLPEPQRYASFSATDRQKFKGVCVHLNIDPVNRDDIGPFVDSDKIVRYGGLTVGDCLAGAAGASASSALPAPTTVDSHTIKVKIGKRAGRVGLSIRQPGDPIPTSPAFDGKASEPAAEGKRDEYLRSAMGFSGAAYKLGSHEPKEGLDGAALVVLCLKRVGLFQGDDVWPNGPALAAHYPVSGSDRAAPPGEILPGDLAWFGSGDHDTDATQNPLIFLGGGRALGPMPDAGTHTGTVQVLRLADVPGHFAGWSHIDDLGKQTSHTAHPGQAPQGTKLTGALLPADPAERYGQLKQLAADRGGKWSDEKGKVNLLGVQELHDLCQISPRSDDWNDTLFACWLDQDGHKSCLELRASLNPGTDSECAGSWQLVDGAYTFKIAAGDGGIAKALVPDGKVKAWFDAEGQSALRPGDSPHDPKGEDKPPPEEEDSGPKPPQETFEGEIKGPGGPLKKWPFKLKRDGTAVAKDAISPGKSSNDFKDGLWFTDGEGKFHFEDVPQGDWTVEVMLAGGKLKAFVEKPAPKGATERGHRAPPQEPIPDEPAENPTTFEES